MKLELYINDRLYESVNIPDAPDGGSLFNRVNDNEEYVDAHVLNLKAMFFKQINRAQNFQIYLVVPSRINKEKQVPSHA